ARLVRRGAPRRLRQLRQLPGASAILGRYGGGTEGLVVRVPHRAALRCRAPGRHPARRRHSEGPAVRPRHAEHLRNRYRTGCAAVAQRVPAAGGGRIARGRSGRPRCVAPDRRERGGAQGRTRRVATLRTAGPATRAQARHSGRRHGGTTCGPARGCRGALRVPARMARGSGTRTERAGLRDLPRPHPARDRTGAPGRRRRPGRDPRCRRRQARTLWRGAAGRSRRIATMESLLVSTLTVALAEIGDKTQLLALLLAARFRKPWPIVAGILVATLLNHAMAGWVGATAASWLTPQVLRWTVAISF